jgi:hypothetical protein
LQALAGPLIFYGTPAGLLLSVLGIFRDSPKSMAIAGAAIAGAAAAYFFGLPLLLR